LLFKQNQAEIRGMRDALEAGGSGSGGGGGGGGGTEAAAVAVTGSGGSGGGGARFGDMAGRAAVAGRE